MSSEIVFDIETVGDIKDYSTLKVTVVSLYDYADQSFRSFEESELSALWPYLEKAERIIGYNSEHFDIPILNRYYAGDLSRFPQLDLLKVIKESSGKRYKLDDIAKATLDIRKSADGLQAVEWYKEGKLDKIKEYCEQDVRVTKGIYEFGRKNKMIYYPTLTGDLMPITVNFDPISTLQKITVQGNINLTLPL
ncbi:MAG: ribonuclease H-like domain-containing protein [Candidatus Magasanikbacteria bacterium]|nr:ribonuclease H-like domain-containing protein [Candidatus Magasanikbacteria bacterium]